MMACAVIAASISASAAPLVLADKGTAKAAILLPAKPTEVESFAAGELAAYLEKMTGGKFEILNEGGRKIRQAVVSIGRTRLAGNLKIQLPAGRRDTREAFRILRRGNALVICGNQQGDACDMGTLWGVCGLLEKLGVGWYLPDPLFEIVPEKPTITMDDIDFTDAPSFSMRWSGGSPASMVKQSHGGYPHGGRQVWFSHMFYMVLTKEVLEANPEFGKEGLCMTNPKLRQLFVDFTRKQFIDNPGMYASSMFPDDNEGPTCGCAECQALLKLGKPEQTLPRATSKSDYLVDFYNGVAGGFAKEFPDRKIIGAAYVSYLDPPVQTKVHPNVIILLTPLTDTSELHPALDGIVKGWREMGAKELYWYGYDMGNPPMPNEIGRRFRNYKRWNLEGVYIEQRPSAAFSGLNYWLEGKLAWNADLEVSGLVDEFCLRLFGSEAGPHMRDFFYAWEEKNYGRAAMQLTAAEECAGDAASPIAKRVRMFRLGWAIARGQEDVQDAFKRDDLKGALEVARRVDAGFKEIQQDYPWAYKDWGEWYSFQHKVREMVPVFEKALEVELPTSGWNTGAPEEVFCLTNNANIAAEKRLETGFTMTYDPAPNYPADNEEKTKLFDGQPSAVNVWNNYKGAFGVWNITLDFQKEYQIAGVEFDTNSPPYYVEIQTSADGVEYTTVDRVNTRMLRGSHRSRILALKSRYVRLVSVSALQNPGLSEVRVWGHYPTTIFRPASPM